MVTSVLPNPFDHNFIFSLLETFNHFSREHFFCLTLCSTGKLREACQSGNIAKIGFLTIKTGKITLFDGKITKYSDADCFI
jgi:hypothetical protein